MDPTTAVWDAFNVDLVVKVLNNTAFSPFFTALIPVFIFFQGEPYTSAAVVSTTLYFIAVSLFCQLDGVASGEISH
jgi:VIT1/CCC1 family predicted Fe2+/Mn2+ transporter